MRKSKYTKESVEKILDAIRQAGGDRSGWEAIGITSATFYAWQNKYPDFAAAVLEAKAEYRQTLPLEQKRQARRAFLDYLYGRVEETWRTEETVIENGAITKKTLTTRVVNRGVPVWAIERVLGKALDITEAIAILAENEILPEELKSAINESVESAKRDMKQAFLTSGPHSDQHNSDGTRKE